MHAAPKRQLERCLPSVVLADRSPRERILMERATGIEPVSEAWEASVLPLYEARSHGRSKDLRYDRSGARL